MTVGIIEELQFNGTGRFPGEDLWWPGLEDWMCCAGRLRFRGSLMDVVEPQLSTLRYTDMELFAVLHVA